MGYYQDNHIQIINQNFLDNDLKDESVQMVCTSPPYWGLRKYSGEQELIWGGDCAHEWGLPQSKTIAVSDKREGMHTERDLLMDGIKVNTGNFCSLCGAWKGALGLEPTPDCGRPFMKLRDDLTPKEREYVLSELRKFGAI